VETPIQSTLEGELTEYYQPDLGCSLPTPEHSAFTSPDEAGVYIGNQVDRRASKQTLLLESGAELRVWHHDTVDGYFTNVYDLSIPSSSARAALKFDGNLKSVGGYLGPEAFAYAAVSGGFLYLADRGSGTPREMALNLALADGRLHSIPVVDREAVVVDKHGVLMVQNIRACGRLLIKGAEVSWSGSRTDYDTEAKVYGNGNVVIEHAAADEPGARKNRIRALDEASRYTPEIEPHSNMVDLGLITAERGRFVIAAINTNGRTDLFQYNAVVRCGQEYAGNIEDEVQFETMDTLRLDTDNYSAISVGPMLVDGNFAEHAINFDPSLGSDPPFYDVRMTRLAIYATEDGRLHVTLFDGRPQSECFKGVTPDEAVRVIREAHGEPVWGAFLDPGRTAKLCTRKGVVTSYGNAHYLRWPMHAGDPYVWVPGAGRPVPSAIILG
jgi:hypothetical protein